MLKKAHSGKYVRMGFVLYGESKIYRKTILYHGFWKWNKGIWLRFFIFR